MTVSINGKNIDIFHLYRKDAPAVQASA
jgi:hypothetical protein